MPKPKIGIGARVLGAYGSKLIEEEEGMPTLVTLSNGKETGPSDGSDVSGKPRGQPHGGDDNDGGPSEEFFYPRTPSHIGGSDEGQSQHQSVDDSMPPPCLTASTFSSTSLSPPRAPSHDSSSSPRYRTMHVGKYMHDGLPVKGDPNPPGWDEFAASLGGRYFRTCRFINGKRFHQDTSEYRTDEESKNIMSFLSTHAETNSVDNGRPFFLYSAPFAPHIQTKGYNPEQPEVNRVAPRYLSLWQNVSHPTSPDFNEANMSDKPPVMQMFPLESPERMSKEYRARLLAVRAVDDMLGKIFDKLAEHKWDNNTFILLTSDNGFQLGHHRMTGKKDPFERSTNVPLFVWGPGIHPAPPAGHLLAHIDLTATILDLGGIEPPSFLDGISFKPLIEDILGFPENAWRRREMLIQHFSTKKVGGISFQTSYASLRRFDSIYTEWSNGDREYYNLSAAADPYQMGNAYDRLTDAERAALVAQIRTTKSSTLFTTTISSPFTSGNVLETPVHLEGVAEDGNGVTEVRLVIQDRGGPIHRYWDGNSFVTERTQIEADLPATGAQIANWTYTFDPPESIASGHYWLSARALSSSGASQQPPVSRTFKIYSSPCKIKSWLVARFRSLPNTNAPRWRMT